MVGCWGLVCAVIKPVFPTELLVGVSLRPAARNGGTTAFYRHFGNPARERGMRFASSLPRLRVGLPFRQARLRPDDR